MPRCHSGIIRVLCPPPHGDSASERGRGSGSEDLSPDGRMGPGGMARLDTE